MSVGEAATANADEFVAERVTVAGWEFAEGLFVEYVIWVRLKSGIDRSESGVGDVSSFPCRGWWEEGVGDAGEDVFAARGNGLQGRAEDCGGDVISNCDGGASGHRGEE